MCKSAGQVFGAVLNPASLLDTPKAPKRVEAPRVADAPPTPPPAPVKQGDVPSTPDANSQEAQSAAADALAEANQRKRKSTFLTGAGGISAQRFGNAGDIRKADLLGGGHGSDDGTESPTRPRPARRSSSRHPPTWPRLRSTSQLESGIRVKLSLESAGKLAHALGVDVGELLKGGGR